MGKSILMGWKGFFIKFQICQHNQLSNFLGVLSTITEETLEISNGKRLKM